MLHTTLLDRSENYHILWDYQYQWPNQDPTIKYSINIAHLSWDLTLTLLCLFLQSLTLKISHTVYGTSCHWCFQYNFTKDLCYDYDFRMSIHLVHLSFVLHQPGKDIGILRMNVCISIGTDLCINYTSGLLDSSHGAYYFPSNDQFAIHNPSKVFWNSALLICSTEFTF